MPATNRVARDILAEPTMVRVKSFRPYCLNSFTILSNRNTQTTTIEIATTSCAIVIKLIMCVVVAYTCRSNYSNVMAQDYEQLSIWQFIKSNSRIQSVNSFQTAYAGLLYHYAFSDKLNGVAYYNFRYMNNVKPRQLTAVSGVYGMGLTYNF
jgi:hypothetical protein